ncbi:MAG: serine/threonine-protein kinase [Gemmataceae bacterium]
MADRPYDFLAPAQAADEIGRLGSYRILKLLGQGGMGMVFQAEDFTLRRPVALKVMRPDVARDPEGVQRFLREARAAAALKHDHVITIYQVGEDRGVPYLAMELLRGQSLDQWMRRHRPTSSQLLKLGREIAEGLAVAHERGLIHRDIKPANVWLEAPQGRVKLLDFGLARTARDDVQLTRSGAIIGTPAYMSPEQARSEPLDGRSDLFSLGVLLYRAGTGQMPFSGDTPLAVLASLLTDTPRPPAEHNPALSPAVNDLILQLLAKKVEDRPASARALIAALRGIASRPPPLPAFAQAKQPLPETESVNPSSPFTELIEAVSEDATLVATPRRKVARGRRVSLLAGAAVVGVGLLAGSLLLLRGDRQPDGPGQANRSAVQAAEGKQDPPAETESPGIALGFYPLEHSTTVSRLQFSPDGKLLASGGEDGVVKVWDVKTGKERATLPQRSKVANLAFSRDSKMIAAWSDVPGPPGRRMMVKFWDIAAAREIPFFESDATGYAPVAFSPDGRIVATASPENSVKLYDLATRKEVGSLTGESDTLSCLAFDAEGKRLALGWPKTTLGLWDVAGRKHLFTRDESTPGAAFPQVHCLAFTADGKTLVAGTGASLTVYALPDGKRRYTFRRHLFGVFSMAVSPDGRMVASVGGLVDPAHAVLTDLATGDTIRELPSWKGYTKGGKGANGVAFSPDGTLLATAGPDHTVKVWDTATWEQRVGTAPPASKPDQPRRP